MSAERSKLSMNRREQCQSGQTSTTRCSPFSKGPQQVQDFDSRVDNSVKNAVLEEERLVVLEDSVEASVSHPEEEAEAAGERSQAVNTGTDSDCSGYTDRHPSDSAAQSSPWNLGNSQSESEMLASCNKMMQNLSLDPAPLFHYVGNSYSERCPSDSEIQDTRYFMMPAAISPVEKESQEERLLTAPQSSETGHVASLSASSSCGRDKMGSCSQSDPQFTETKAGEEKNLDAVFDSSSRNTLNLGKDQGLALSLMQKDRPDGWDSSGEGAPKSSEEDADMISDQHGKKMEAGDTVTSTDHKADKVSLMPPKGTLLAKVDPAINEDSRPDVPLKEVESEQSFPPDGDSSGLRHMDFDSSVLRILRSDRFSVVRHTDDTFTLKQIDSDSSSVGQNSEASVSVNKNTLKEMLLRAYPEETEETKKALDSSPKESRIMEKVSVGLSSEEAKAVKKVSLWMSSKDSRTLKKSYDSNPKKSGVMKTVSFESCPEGYSTIKTIDSAETCDEQQRHSPGDRQLEVDDAKLTNYPDSNDFDKNVVEQYVRSIIYKAQTQLERELVDSWQSRVAQSCTLEWDEMEVIRSSTPEKTHGAEGQDQERDSYSKANSAVTQSVMKDPTQSITFESPKPCTTATSHVTLENSKMGSALTGLCDERNNSKDLNVTSASSGIQKVCGENKKVKPELVDDFRLALNQHRSLTSTKNEEDDLKNRGGTEIHNQDAKWNDDDRIEQLRSGQDLDLSLHDHTFSSVDCSILKNKSSFADETVSKEQQESNSLDMLSLSLQDASFDAASAEPEMLELDLPKVNVDFITMPNSVDITAEVSSEVAEKDPELVSTVSSSTYSTSESSEAVSAQSKLSSSFLSSVDATLVSSMKMSTPDTGCRIDGSLVVPNAPAPIIKHHDTLPECRKNAAWKSCTFTATSAPTSLIAGKTSCVELPVSELSAANKFTTNVASLCRDLTLIDLEFRESPLFETNELKTESPIPVLPSTDSSPFCWQSATSAATTGSSATAAVPQPSSPAGLVSGVPRVAVEEQAAGMKEVCSLEQTVVPSLDIMFFKPPSLPCSVKEESNNEVSNVLPKSGDLLSDNAAKTGSDGPVLKSSEKKAEDMSAQPEPVEHGHSVGNIPIPCPFEEVSLQHKPRPEAKKPFTGKEPTNSGAAKMETKSSQAAPTNELKERRHFFFKKPSTPAFVFNVAEHLNKLLKGKVTPSKDRKRSAEAMFAKDCTRSAAGDTLTPSKDGFRVATEAEPGRTRDYDRPSTVSFVGSTCQTPSQQEKVPDNVLQVCRMDTSHRAVQPFPAEDAQKDHNDENVSVVSSQDSADEPQNCLDVSKETNEQTMTGKTVDRKRKVGLMISSPEAERSEEERRSGDNRTRLAPLKRNQQNQATELNNPSIGSEAPGFTRVGRKSSIFPDPKTKQDGHPASSPVDQYTLGVPVDRNRKRVSVVDNRRRKLTPYYPGVQGLLATTVVQSVFEQLGPLKGKSPTVPPLYIVHPITGSVNLLKELADNLDVRCIGIKKTDQALDFSVETLARFYCQAILQHYCEPYRLAGYSYGGLLVFEMARQLQREGKKVELLLMLDGSPDYVKTQIESMRQHLPPDASPEHRQAVIEAHFLLYFIQFYRPVHRRELVLAMLEQQKCQEARVEAAIGITMGTVHVRANTAQGHWLSLKSKMEMAKQGPRCRISMTHVADDLISLKRQQKAMKFLRAANIADKYDITVGELFHGDINLVRIKTTPEYARLLPADYGLHRLCTGTVRTFYVDGEHESMLQSPNVKSIAGVVRKLLKACTK